MFAKTIGLGVVFGVIGCATEPVPRADEPDRQVERSAAGRDAGLDQRQLAPKKDAAAAPQTPDEPSAPARAESFVAEAGVAAAPAAYPGTGFVVHEWGTNTAVVGSSGKLLRGMHHEEEDLPAFVYDRLRQGEFLGFPSVGKMETPVDYFYADKPLTAKVSVGMPHGILTQWYPAVQEFAPSILGGAFGRSENVDPYLELGLPFDTQRCIDKYTTVAGGRLDWGDVEVLTREGEVTPILPDAPLERFTWSYARDVAANLIRVRNPSAHTVSPSTGEVALVRGPESERFLFYRGLGTFALPVEVMAWGNGVKLTNRSPWPTRGPVFVLEVGEQTGAFAVTDGALLPSGELTAEAALPIDSFVDALDAAMTDALLGTGLYRDEAVAMVRTWRRQWFRTPGTRVLYFAPAAWIDSEVPLSISPAPDSLLRVMVLRVEVLRRGTEDTDLKFVAGLDGGDLQQTAESHFRRLGRFAEPRLRRALENLGSVPSGAAAFLKEIEHPNASFALGE